MRSGAYFRDGTAPCYREVRGKEIKTFRGACPILLYVLICCCFLCGINVCFIVVLCNCFFFFNVFMCLCFLIRVFVLHWLSLFICFVVCYVRRVVYVCFVLFCRYFGNLFGIRYRKVKVYAAFLRCHFLDFFGVFVL